MRRLQRFMRMLRNAGVCFGSRRARRAVAEGSAGSVATLLWIDAAPPIGLCTVGLEARSDTPLRLYYDIGTGFDPEFMTELVPDEDGFIQAPAYVPLGLLRMGLEPSRAGAACPEQPLVFTPASRFDNLEFLFTTRSSRHVPWWLWPLMAAVRGIGRLRSRYRATRGAAAQYQVFLKRLEPEPEADLAAAKLHLQAFTDPPSFSILVPVYNTPIRWLERAIASVRAQVYPHWQLCLADDASPDPAIRAALGRAAAVDSRICWVSAERNGGISAASNLALGMAKGRFITFLDHDDELHPLALYWVAAALQEQPELDLIYTDEDKLDVHGRRYDPHFKPDWNPELLESINYIAHLAVYRRSLVEDLGGLRSVCDGSQDYDLSLRVSAATRAQRIRHLPVIAYHWRAIPGSTALDLGEKSYPHQAGLRALADHFAHQGPVVVESGAFPTSYRVRFPLPSPPPRVSAIVPTRDGYAHLHKCINGLLQGTDYPDLEVLLVDNQSTDPDTLEYFAAITADSRARVLRYDAPFNYSAINNFAADQASGEVLLLLNDDTEIIHRDWLSEMVGLCLRPDVGAVGAKLYYTDDTVQHGGVALGIGGVAGHVHLAYPRHSAGYMGRLMLRQQFSAVTAACLVVEKRKFDAVSGLDADHLSVAFNDIDFCLRLGEQGWRTVWTPWAQLYHHESKSRGPDTAPDKKARFERETLYMKRRWGAVLRHDPCYSRHFSLMRQDYSLAEVPRAWRPWMERPA